MAFSTNLARRQGMIWKEPPRKAKSGMEYRRYGKKKREDFHLLPLYLLFLSSFWFRLRKCMRVPRVRRVFHVQLLGELIQGDFYELYVS